MNLVITRLARSRTLAAASDTWPLLAGMGLLMLGAGLQGTLISVRATLAGFATPVIGIVMSCYYLGYMAGSIGAPQLVHRVGHIRVFAALAAIASVTILLQGLWVSPTLWGTLRLVSGFCFAGIYVVAESWLNNHASNENRGSLLAVYMLVLYVGLGGGQFLLNVADPSGQVLFIIIAIMISLAVVPMTLTVQRAPQYEVRRHTSYRELLHVSPLGVIGVMASGAITSSLFAMGPVYAQLIGLKRSQIAVFMSASIFAAVITQLPIGRWSDRVDRRTVLVTVCALGTLAAILAGTFGRESNGLLLLLMGCFGGVSLSLYSLSLSHINDHLLPSQMVGASGTIILLNGVGATIGPSLAAFAMQTFGASVFFAYLAVLVGTLGVYAVYRKSQRAPVPPEQKGHFVTAQPQVVSGQIIAEMALRNVPGQSNENA
jgi:MFS family permease